MKQELVRINSIDEIEMPGILYSPEEETEKIVLHVHGLNGNFYENRFLDALAEKYTSEKMAFLTFNNRGRDYISDMKKGNESVVIGGSLENFKECLLDIEGVVNYVKELGYKYIILEGHSYGCNKVLYYFAKKKHEEIKKIILLAPCDIPAECMKFLSDKEYTKAKEEATRLVEDGKGEELIDFSVMTNGKIAARTFYNDFLPGGEDDFIRYRDGENVKSKLLENIDIPVLIVFGDIDECVLTESLETVKDYLKNNIEKCEIKIIKGANHSYDGKYEELTNSICNV